MSSRSWDEYVVLRSYPQSPPLSARHSSESDDSLRALEVSQGPDMSSRRGPWRCAGINSVLFNFGSDICVLEGLIQYQALIFNMIWCVPSPHTSFLLCSLHTQATVDRKRNRSGQFTWRKSWEKHRPDKWQVIQCYISRQSHNISLLGIALIVGLQVGGCIFCL